MTRYGATMEGAQGLRKLANDLMGVVAGLEECSSKLESTISGLSQLGDFEPKIQDVVTSVSQAQSQGRESIEELAGKVNDLASAVESVCTLL